MKLGFGYNAGLPDDAQAAWGARLIVTQDGSVDFLADRQDAVGDDNVRKPFLDLLSERYPLPTMRSDIGERLRSGEIGTRVEREVELYDDAEVHVVGNSNASAGYFYVTAYRKGVRRQRTPGEILADFDRGTDTAAEGDGIDMRGLLWEVIEDVRASYRLAMESLAPSLDPNRVDEVQQTVLDYLTDNFGDD